MARDPAPTDGNDKTQRRVYVLPTELVERIVAYQNELGLSSEVEAARRLLDEALLSRDTVVSIVSRVVAQLKTVRSLREAAREVLASHPLITHIVFNPADLCFKTSDGHNVEVTDKGVATIKDEQNDYYSFGFGVDPPEWAADVHRPKRPSFGRSSPMETRAKSMSDAAVDDDIPF
ncbi:MAG: hypothetical protein ACRYGP_20915 [Janthinobacterium lividum]